MDLETPLFPFLDLGIGLDDSETSIDLDDLRIDSDGETGQSPGNIPDRSPFINPTSSTSDMGPYLSSTQIPESSSIFRTSGSTLSDQSSFSLSENYSNQRLSSNVQSTLSSNREPTLASILEYGPLSSLQSGRQTSSLQSRPLLSIKSEPSSTVQSRPPSNSSSSRSSSSSVPSTRYSDISNYELVGGDLFPDYLEDDTMCSHGSFSDICLNCPTRSPRLADDQIDSGIESITPSPSSLPPLSPSMSRNSQSPPQRNLPTPQLPSTSSVDTPMNFLLPQENDSIDNLSSVMGNMFMESGPVGDFNESIFQDLNIEDFPLYTGDQFSEGDEPLIEELVKDISTDKLARHNSNYKLARPISNDELARHISNDHNYCSIQSESDADVEVDVVSVPTEPNDSLVCSPPPIYYYGVPPFRPPKKAQEPKKPRRPSTAPVASSAPPVKRGRKPGGAAGPVKRLGRPPNPKKLQPAPRNEIRRGGVAKRPCPPSRSSTMDPEKRSLHNQMERERRVQLKRNLDSLKDRIPTLLNENRLSKQKILNFSREYILTMQKDERQFMPKKRMLLENQERLKREFEYLREELGKCKNF